MASWVLSISEDYPQHWGYAQKHQMWDLKKFKPIKNGDLVYYWQAGTGGTWAGRARATQDAYRISTSSPAGPWDDWPGPPYEGRFSLEVLDAAPTLTPTWTNVTTDMGVKFSPSWYREVKDSHGAAVLASYFGHAELTPEQSLNDARREQVFADLSEDLRVRTLQVIALRQGQSAFRKSLLTAYSGACAVTGTATERVLEAAHIAPYKGEHTNLSSNGLLLRADVHTLFDLHLVTITPDHIVHVSTEVKDSEYSQYDGQSLAHLPPTLTDLPDGEQLSQHNAECAWLAT